MHDLVAGEALQLLTVARGHQTVRRGEGQPELVIGRHEVGIGARVELFARVPEQQTLADLVENRGHPVIAELAEHRRQRDGRELVAMERVGGEKVRRPVAVCEEAGLGLGDDRRQLVEVTDQDELHTAERAARVGAEAVQCGGDLVEQVGADHRGLVDDEGVQGLEGAGEPPGVVTAGADIGEGGGAGEAEQPVDGVALHVEGRDAGGRDDDHIAIRLGHEPADQCRLPGAGLAGEEDVAAVGQQGHRVAEFVGEDEVAGGHATMVPDAVTLRRPRR